jgi:hypothetical protein
MSNRIIMYWDRVDSLGDPIAGIEILSDEAIEIPPDACGFRLGLPNHNWYEGWHFTPPGGVSPFANGGIKYSSAFTGVPPPMQSLRPDPFMLALAGRICSRPLWLISGFPVMSR